MPPGLLDAPDLAIEAMDVENQRGVTLSQLLKGYPLLNLIGTLERPIQSVVYDSREARPGSLFVAIHGLRQDGGLFIKDAIRRGAVACVTEDALDEPNGFGLGAKGVTAVSVADCRNALSWISNEFYDHPSEKIEITGITGTNGKTTLTYILEHLFKSQGQSTGVIGTVNYRYNDIELPAQVTTPESSRLNHLLDDMARRGISRCFLEVSSHSLALQRVRGLRFSVGVFTNLSRDHLDFHGTMEEYARAKKKLFFENRVEKQVINIDDPVGREILNESKIETLTTGIDASADVMAEDLRLTDRGCRFTLKTPFGSEEMESRLLGKHNVYNLLSASAAALLQEVPLDGLRRGMRSLDRIPGRAEPLDCGQDFLVLVDYAHTDEALKNILAAVRAYSRGKTIVVFGCGGDRDRGKRKLMAQAALAGSDYAVVTSDNPRTEPPGRIVDDILEGVPPGAKLDRDYAVLIDRAEAIEHAVNRAQSGDVVVIAGKGHEDYQILNTGTIHFDDREAARNALRKRLKLD